MQTSMMLTAFLMPGVLVVYWVITDWMKERAVRRKWATEPLLSDAIKRPGSERMRRVAVGEE